MAFSMARARSMTVIERFMDKVDKREDGCWWWKGGLKSKGYGFFYWGPTQKDRGAAHRYAYTHFVGPIPDGLFVCHKCDNPRCVNPEHLFVGTAGDNYRDMAEKGRAFPLQRPSSVGKRHAAKLTMEQITAIRAMREAGLSYGELADVFGCTASNIGYICRKLTWT